MLQQKLNRDEPYGPVFAGTGETSDVDKVCKFYQHGLYFDALGNLLEDHPYNAKKVGLIKKLGMNPDKPAEEIITPAAVAANPETVAQLDAMSDAKLYDMAVKLVAINAENGTDDDYEPLPEERDSNMRFIAKYAG